MAWAKILYSTLELDLEISVSFLIYQETKLGPRKMQAPYVDVLSSRSEAKSSSQNSTMVIGKMMLTGISRIPWLMVPCKYLKILLTAS